MSYFSLKSVSAFDINVDNCICRLKTIVIQAQGLPQKQGGDGELDEPSQKHFKIERDKGGGL